jgi:hypothetical protein
MAQGYVSNRNLKKGNQSTVACVASTTNQISEVLRISAEDSRNLLVNVTFSLVEETNTLNVVLQDSVDNGTTWATVKTSAVATTKAVHTLTFLTKANTVDGDYVVLEDTAGTQWAIATDATGSSAEPTGAVWVAIDAANKGQADISADTTAADVAARFETAFNALSGFTALITSDDTAADGTMTMTQVKGGTVTAPVVKDDDDAGAGTIVGANTTPGAATLSYELENNVYDGTDTAIWPIARVVVTAGVGDSATVSGLTVTQRL